MPLRACVALGLALSLAGVSMMGGCSSPGSTEPSGSNAASMSLRTFPADALRGRMEVTSVQEATINGRPVRMAPGVVIRGENNMVQTPNAFMGKTLTVNYRLDFNGHVTQAWVLTPTEQARAPWPRTAEEAKAWQFDALRQVWTRR